MTTIILPPALADLIGRREVATSAATVLEAVKGLDALRPGMYDRVCTEQHEPRKHVLIFLDETDVRLLDGMKTALKGGEKIFIIPAFSGG